MDLYTFIGLINTVPMGSQSRATMDEVKALMACDTHGVNFQAVVCDSCSSTLDFISTLRYEGQAIHTDYSEDGKNVHISVAVYIGESE